MSNTTQPGPDGIHCELGGSRLDDVDHRQYVAENEGTLLEGTCQQADDDEDDFGMDDVERQRDASRAWGR